MKKIILNFFVDKLGVTLAYFINTFFIILFFYLYIDRAIPILYPIILAVFIYILFYVYEFYKYCKFSLSIKEALENRNVEICDCKKQYEEIKNLVDMMNNDYLKTVNTFKEESKTNNHFFSQWVHNMKTPISVNEIIIQKLSEYIDKSKINEDKEEKLLIIKLIEELSEENNKLLNGLDSILNMIRLEDFSKDYNPEPINIYTSLVKVINDRKRQFVYSNIFPKIICDCKDENVLSDEKWNEFILNQIISNAIKYSRAFGEDKFPSKYLYFNIEKREKCIILSIKDEGIGIPNYDIDRVFEAFFTGDNGRKYKNSTGIGLYICKIVCKKLGHSISIESELGKGTEIRIRYLIKL